MTNAEARCNKSLRARKPEGSLGRTAQDVHLDSHTAPELCLVRQANLFICFSCNFVLATECACVRACVRACVGLKDLGLSLSLYEMCEKLIFIVWSPFSEGQEKLSIDSLECSSPRKSLVKGERFSRLLKRNQSNDEPLRLCTQPHNVNQIFTV